MRIGVLGAGQLGLMLAEAGEPLGISLRFLDPAPEAPAGRLRAQVVAAYDDLEAIDRFAEGLDAATFEFENVCSRAAARLESRVPLRPGPRSLEISQDRIVEKRFFESCGIPVPEFAAVSTRAELAAAIAEIGAPAILKTRRFGYDGKGQAAIDGPSQLDAAWAAVGGVPCILEARVPFVRELSVLAVRSGTGEIRAWTPVENHHRGGILRRTISPAPRLEAGLATQATGLASTLAERLGHVGVLALELFETPGGTLLANEFAPRVHNSGHWTIEGSVTSQFENHLRAVAGWPLGSTASLGPAVMENLIGAPPPIGRLLEVPGARVHLYGKSPRAGRKVGHVTLLAADSAEAIRRADAIAAASEAERPLQR